MGDDRDRVNPVWGNVQHISRQDRYRRQTVENTNFIAIAVVTCRCVVTRGHIATAMGGVEIAV